MGKLRTLVAAALVALAALPASAQTGGTIAGRVTDAQSNGALSGASVTVGGTTRRTVTNAQGEYRITGVPAGTYAVTVALIGRQGNTRQVRVANGETATANFTLGANAVAIEGLVVTATGEQARAREVGVAVGRVNVAEDVELAAVNDVAQVLQGRTAGVTVLQASGTSGTGARVRIRGSNSVSLSNDPLLVIDGVRTDPSSSGLAVGGQTTSRLTDLNPEEIESIEVLKGPAAAALYGTAAANGVLVVTTKKGRAGRTQFRGYTELGTVRDVTEFPDNVNGFCSIAAPTAQDPNRRLNYDVLFGLTPAQSTGTYCDIGTYTNPDLQEFDIRLDSIVRFNPLEDSRTTPFETGQRTKVGLSASGGTERVTYFLSGDRDYEGGVYKYDLSTIGRTSLRANLRGQITDKFDLTVNTGFVNSEIRLPQNDNNALGVVSGSLLSSRFRYDSASAGYGFGIRPDQIALINTRENINRLTSSVLGNYRPLSWLSFTTQLGMDAVERFEFENVSPGDVPYSATYLEGYRTTGRSRGTAYTANVNGTANFGLGERITGSTSAGVQYSEDVLRGISASGSVLLEGTSSLQGLATRFAIGETNFHVRTIGTYVQQQIGLNDRLFLTGSVRADRNSAFGSDYGWVAYPSISGSWVLRDEPFFPELDFLSTFRLRAAYGQSGLRPGTSDAFRFNNPVSSSVGGASVASFSLGGVGNTELKPERSTEVELGFDMGLFGDRIGTEVTYFNKRSDDALINAPIPPSVGVAASRRENLGSVRNTGVEFQLNSRLVERGNLRWDATVTATRMRNELLGLGERITPIIFGLGGNTQRHTPGRPLGAYFATPYTFEDVNTDGFISPDELTFAEGDTAEYVGSPFPTREASLQSNLQLGVFRLSGLLDYRGGFYNFNSTREFRCGSYFNCTEIYDPATSLEDQAAAIATAYYGNSFGYMEKADFVKLREVSLSVGLPRQLAERLGSSGLSLTFAGRNLKTWTDYKGFDPEINFAGSGSNFSTAEFLTQPPARFFTARLDVSF